MPKFNLDNYELVEDRLKKFWKDYPNGRVDTTVVSSSADGTMVIVKAELYMEREDTTPVSSGLAQETKGLGGFANNEAWLENAESSAIGRALANWKYQGNKKPRPTQEEMKKVTPPTKKEVALTTNESANKFAEDIGADKKKVADQLNEILDAMTEDKDILNKLKTKTFSELTKSKKLSTDIESWSADDISLFTQVYEEHLQVVEPVEAVFDVELKEVKKKCTECNSSEIEDNREKKEQDPAKFGKIPDFACQKPPYGTGCGKAWWINNAPEEWL